MRNFLRYLVKPNVSIAEFAVFVILLTFSANLILNLMIIFISSFSFRAIYISILEDEKKEFLGLFQKLLKQKVEIKNNESDKN